MRRALAAVVVSATLLAGCTDPSGGEAAPTVPAPPATAQAEPRLERYVALGDSFTAGPLVPVTDLAEGCFRSDGNYPSLLAADLDLTLTDVSCSGASTRDLVRRQRTVGDASVPPQLRFVDPETDLVTLGIGGNDLGLFGRLVRTCLDLRAQDPAGSPCAESPVGRTMLASTDTIGDAVARAVGRVQRRAPDARVVLVGYLRIAPPSGECPRRLPFATGDVAFGDRVLRALGDALRGAAATTGSEYLDAYEASAGHDVCSDEPWVNGRVTRAGVAFAFHPLQAGMRALAAELESLLAEG